MSSVPDRSTLILLAAETAPQRRQLCRAFLERCWSSHQAVQVIDLNAEPALLDHPQPPGLDRHCYSLEAWSEELWHDLLPVLSPWLTLLELDHPGDKPPFLGAIPGLAGVLQALYLARCWDRRRPGQTLVVVLPPPAQACEILQLLGRGPELLEELWTPLLRWWAQTRQRLSQVELVLRLRLPAADTLALSPGWRACLDAVATQLQQGQDRVEVLLALAAEVDDLPAIGTRLAAWPLCGLPRLRLWLEAQLPAATVAQLQVDWRLPLCVGRLGELGGVWGDWLQQSWPGEPLQWITSGDGVCCRLFLPGLSREGLQVRHGDGQLLIQSGTMQLQVAMPPAWAQLACRSARIDAPWLEIGFS